MPSPSAPAGKMALLGVLALQLGLAVFLWTRPPSPSGGYGPEGLPVGPPGPGGGSPRPMGPQPPSEILQSYLDPQRDQWQGTATIMDELDFRPGQVVADIGAGSGYFTCRIARAVAPTGKVYAVDIDPAAIDFMRNRLAGDAGLADIKENVELVSSRPDDVTLPQGVLDWGFICRVHFTDNEDTLRCLESLRRALKPDGRVAVIEWRQAQGGEFVSSQDVRRPFLKAGFKLQKELENLPQDYFLIFSR
ncbi:MAG TPA: methyltransferase domain-containing protein [Candidatus Nitrosotenuis sp.]|nr:methyltransferase domain-containing protein [Candidatus Nitrosotenuis sp.]